MKVDKFDFAVPDLMTKRKDFSDYINSMIEVLEKEYNDFIFNRDNGFWDEIDTSDLLVGYLSLTEIVVFLAVHRILKRHAFEKIELFTDKIMIDIKEYENLNGGNYV